MVDIHPRGQKHIGINAHLLSASFGYRRAGIHHYISQLIAHLPGQGDDFEFTIFANNKSNVRAGGSMKVQASRWPTSQRYIRILWEQLAWPLLASRLKIDLLHSMAFVTPLLSGHDNVVTVYDLSFLHFPDRFPVAQRAYLASQTKRSCRNANRVVTISEASRQDVHQMFDIPLEIIDVVYPGVDTTFYPRQLEELRRFREARNIQQRYILHVGTLQPRKNIPTLIKAFAQLKHPDVHLVLVGGKGWLFDEIFAMANQLGVADRLRFAGYVADEDLPLWYSAASILILPSEYEGFGFPAAQAMASGTPVIATNVSAIPEVTGDAALLFDPYDVPTLVSYMETVLDDTQIAATMRAQGIEQAQQFTWQEAGHRMVETYEKILT